MCQTENSDFHDNLFKTTDNLQEKQMCNSSFFVMGGARNRNSTSISLLVIFFMRFRNGNDLKRLNSVFLNLLQNIRSKS